MSNKERAIQIVVELQKLGVSHKGIRELIERYPYGHIEAQLKYLPYRKAKRPEAFIIEAVRQNFSPPSDYYAQTQTNPPTNPDALDQDA